MSMSNEANQSLYINNATYRSLAYRFSNTSFGTGTLISFNTFNSIDLHTVNYDSYQLSNGSCTDSVTSSHFDKLSAYPWGPLDEVYYECTAFAMDAVLDGAGIAQGTIDCIAHIAAFVVMFVFMLPGILSGERLEKGSGSRVRIHASLHEVGGDGHVHLKPVSDIATLKQRQEKMEKELKELGDAIKKLESLKSKSDDSA